jgi:diguanylate cyclase (GGDEF)-like protein
VAQYGGLLLFGNLHWDLQSADWTGRPEGAYEPLDQVTRLILLAAAAFLTDTIIRRARRLLGLALYDPLTGVLNRGALDRHLSIEMERARRLGHELVVAIVDADHFKQINDRYGHAMGDRALTRIADVLRDGLRRHDTVVRYGGEEFVLIMPHVSAINACRRIEGLRDGLRAPERRPAAAEEAIPPITVSAGVAAYPHDGVDPQVLLKTADVRLLLAQRLGRDRVVGPLTSVSRAPASVPLGA